MVRQLPKLSLKSLLIALLCLTSLGSASAQTAATTPAAPAAAAADAEKALDAIGAARSKTVIIVFDVSYSMIGSGVYDPAYEACAKIIKDTLKDGDRVDIITFDAKPTFVLEDTTYKNELRYDIAGKIPRRDSIVPSNRGTNIRWAHHEALKKLDAAPTGNKFVVLITDSFNDQPTAPNSASPEIQAQYSGYRAQYLKYYLPYTLTGFPATPEAQDYQRLVKKFNNVHSVNMLGIGIQIINGNPIERKGSGEGLTVVGSLPELIDPSDRTNIQLSQNKRDLILSVIYRDADGDKPEQLSAVVDGATIDMPFPDTTVEERRKGVTITRTYPIPKPEQNHDFIVHFEAQDRDGRTRFPAKQEDLTFSYQAPKSNSLLPWLWVGIPLLVGAAIIAAIMRSKANAPTVNVQIRDRDRPINTHQFHQLRPNSKIEVGGPGPQNVPLVGVSEVVATIRCNSHSSFTLMPTSNVPGVIIISSSGPVVQDYSLTFGEEFTVELADHQRYRLVFEEYFFKASSQKGQ